jgi:hypothetical protein
MMHLLDGLNDDKVRSAGFSQDQLRRDISRILGCPTFCVSRGGFLPSAARNCQVADLNPG